MAISSARYSPACTGYDLALASQVPEAFMKALFGVGLVILVLGILSFFVPIPHSKLIPNTATALLRPSVLCSLLPARA